VELYLHLQYVIMAWCLVKHRGNFTLYICMKFGGKVRTGCMCLRIGASGGALVNTVMMYVRDP